MKSFKLKSSLNFVENPLILVIGDDSNKQKFVEKLLTDENFLSKKFGRIIYLGEKEYKSHLIQVDEQNSIKEPKYDELTDLFDNSKKEKIINMLLVLNTNQGEKYVEIIEKIMGLRFSFLNGTISFLLCVNDLDKISKETFENSTNVFLFDSKYENKIFKHFSVEKKEEKKKKEVWFIGNKNLQKILT